MLGICNRVNMRMTIELSPKPTLLFGRSCNLLLYLACILFHSQHIFQSTSCAEDNKFVISSDDLQLWKETLDATNEQFAYMLEAHKVYLSNILSSPTITSRNDIKSIILGDQFDNNIGITRKEMDLLLRQEDSVSMTVTRADESFFIVLLDICNIEQQDVLTRTVQRRRKIDRLLSDEIITIWFNDDNIIDIMPNMIHLSRLYMDDSEFMNHLNFIEQQYLVRLQNIYRDCRSMLTTWARNCQLTGDAHQEWTQVSGFIIDKIEELNNETLEDYLDLESQVDPKIAAEMRLLLDSSFSYYYLYPLAKLRYTADILEIYINDNNISNHDATNIVNKIKIFYKANYLSIIDQSLSLIYSYQIYGNTGFAISEVTEEETSLNNITLRQSVIDAIVLRKKLKNTLENLHITKTINRIVQECYDRIEITYNSSTSKDNDIDSQRDEIIARRSASLTAYLPETLEEPLLLTCCPDLAEDASRLLAPMAAVNDEIKSASEYIKDLRIHNAVREVSNGMLGLFYASLEETKLAYDRFVQVRNSVNISQDKFINELYTRNISPDCIELYNFIISLDRYLSRPKEPNYDLFRTASDVNIISDRDRTNPIRMLTLDSTEGRRVALLAIEIRGAELLSVSKKCYESSLKYWYDSARIYATARHLMFNDDIEIDREIFAVEVLELNNTRRQYYRNRASLVSEVQILAELIMELLDDSSSSEFKGSYYDTAFPIIRKDYTRITGLGEWVFSTDRQYAEYIFIDYVEEYESLRDNIQESAKEIDPYMLMGIDQNKAHHNQLAKIGLFLHRRSELNSTTRNLLQILSD